MTIAIVLAAIVVVIFVGVWLLRKQASEARDGADPPLVEDGPPGSEDENAGAGPRSKTPWLQESEAGPDPRDSPVEEEQISSAAPQALPVDPFPPTTGPPPAARQRPRP